MENKILIISNYEENNNLQDGMMQRIYDIDKKLINYDKKYLNLSYFKNLFKKEEANMINKKLDLNILKDYKIIGKYIDNYNIIYVHSLYNLIRLSLFKNKLREKRVIIDLHGAVVEELEFYGEKVKSYIFSKLEKDMFEVCDVFIYVNNKMKEFYTEKYNFIKKKENFVCCIIPQNLNITDKKYKDDNFEYFVKDKEKVLVYSGNTQKWQNVEMIFPVIEKYSDKKYGFVFLSKDTEYFHERLKDINVEKNILFIKSVKPENLNYYYNKCNLGFILRDDITVNNVANPTKLIEYLYYDIIPIIKSSKIGDFEELGYRYIKYDEIFGDSFPIHEKHYYKNKEIILNLINENKNMDFKRIVLGEKYGI